MVRYALIVLATTTMISNVAFAADLRGPLQDEPVAPPLVQSYGFDWSGPYVGLNVGYSSGKEDFGYAVPSDSLGGTDSQHSRGVVGGAQIGYDYAVGHGFVIGAEADFDGTSISNGAPLDQPLLATRISNSINYFGTVQGRLGYAFDRVMLYGTGGFAYADVETSVSAPQFNIADHSTHMHMGYVFGGGVEYALSNNLALRIEYLRLQYNSQSAPGILYQLSERPSENIVRAGLDYRFDLFGQTAPRPIIVRY